MRLQNNILIFFYAIFFFIYFNFDSIELKAATPPNNTSDNKIPTESDENEGGDDNEVDNKGGDENVDIRKGVNILSIESDNKSGASDDGEESDALSDIFEDETENKNTNEESDDVSDVVSDIFDDTNEESDDVLDDVLDDVSDDVSDVVSDDVPDVVSDDVSDIIDEVNDENTNEEINTSDEKDVDEESDKVNDSDELNEETNTNDDKDELVEEKEIESEYEESEDEKDVKEESNSSPSDKNKSNVNSTESKESKYPWNKFNLFTIFKKPLLKKRENNYFRREIQNESAFRNGLYFTATNVASYNRLVDKSRYASIPLPGNTMVFVVTANKFFFQDLIYSNNKYLSIKKKFSYLMNGIIQNLKSKYYFKNFNYQYLYKDDSFAGDKSNKVLDFVLLGDLSKATQTIYVDEYRGRISMHKLYGGWFHFLGILVVNGYSYNVVDNLGSLEVVPYHLLDEFKKTLYRKENNHNNGYLMGLWRDFPNNKYSVWRFSVELFLWDILNMMPHQLPHPASFVLSYNETKKIEGKDNTYELLDDQEKNSILNWHLTIKKYISEIKGLDVVMVSANDYLAATNHKGYNTYLNKYRNSQKNNGYIFLILLNKDFFIESLSHNDYQEDKKHRFFGCIKDVIERITELLNKLKDFIDQVDQSENKPTVQFYNYLLEETNYDKINPHILGEIAGITKHIKCKNYANKACKKDVSIHYKYGGWFEFGGALYIKNVNNIKVNYEKHNIIDKKYEKIVLQRANCPTCRDVDLWRDIPGKDMSKYRYPLNVFVMERPELDLKDINLRDIHPFILLSLLKKGIESEKRFPLLRIYSDEKTDTEQNLEDAIDSENNESLNEKDINMNNVFSEENHVEGNNNENKSMNNSEEDNNEIQNGVESDENEKQSDDIESKNEENNKVYGSNEENGILGGFNNVDELDDELNEDNDWLNNKESDENLDEDLEYEKIDELLENASKIDNNKNQENAEDMDKMNHLYDVYESVNDLNNSSSDNSNFVYRKLFLFLIGCIIIACISFIIVLGIKLYKKFINKKMLDKNKVVLAFKDKEEIPVVQGIPAPWLNT